MRFISQLAIIVILWVMPTKDALASHLIGGDASYTFITYNSDSSEVTYLVRYDLYKDTYNGANLGASIPLGVYKRDGNGGWEFVREWTASGNGSPTDIPGKDEPCREEPPASQVAVETVGYTVSMTLDVIDTDYMITYLRCCRNDDITNMFGDETGAVIDLLITSAAQNNGNSSPKFNSFPSIFICAGFDLDEDLSCRDSEGDQIIYSFCTPITEGAPNNDGICDNPNPDAASCPPPYDEINYRPGFTAAEPMGGNPVVRINPVTGLITGIPETTGLYVVGICVEEYRNGELLTVMRRDFQFRALTCIKEISASLEADEVIIDNSTGISRPRSILKACGDSIVEFKGIDINTTITDYTWNITDPNGETIVDTSGFLVRNLEVYFPELGEYRGMLVVTDSEGCVDTAFLSVLRLPDMETEYEFEVLDSCYLGPVQFTDLSEAEQSQIIKWNWDFSGESTSDEKDPIFEFGSRGRKQVTLISEDLNTCLDTFIDFIDYNPPHDRLLISNPDSTFCFGDSIFFDERWIKSAGDYSDTLKYAQTSCDSIERYLSFDYHPMPQPTYVDTVLCPGEVLDYYGVVYSEDGTFEHQTLSRTSFCDSLLHFVKLKYEVMPEITVVEDFIYVTANKDFELPVRITGDYAQSIWTPSEGLSCDDCPYPTLNFNSDTTYILTLETPAECRTSDSITIDFKVVPNAYYVPTIIDKNAINSDDRYFFLQTIEEAYEDVRYSMKVFDRWGGLMHDGKDLIINDRNVGFSAHLVESGSYVYVMEIEEFFEMKSLVGTITVID